MADVGPPIALVAIGPILWLAITATIGGISIQTIGRSCPSSAWSGS